MKVISIINNKGGVGKTTITANIGVELSKKGYKTLLIDTDPQANLTTTFLETNNNLKFKSLRNLFTGYFDNKEIIELEKIIIQPEIINSLVDNNLYLIGSSMEFYNDLIEEYPVYLNSSRRKKYLTIINMQSILRNALMKYSEVFDYVLIDCSPYFNLISQNAIVASDYYVVPVKLDYLSRDGLTELLVVINNLILNYNKIASRDLFERHEKINPKLLGIIPNMVKYNNNELTSDLKNNFEKFKKLSFGEITNNYIFKQMLRDYPSVYLKSQDSKIPSVIDTDNKVIQNELIRLVNEFLERIELIER